MICLYFLFLNLGADVNCENDSGETALYVASYYGEETMIDVLLQFGADPN